MSSARPILYLDQNAWVVLAKGAWDKEAYPAEHAALATVIELVRNKGYLAPLSFTNLYETAKINDPARRFNLARTQALISGGWVFRGRRRVLTETLEAYLAARFSIARPPPADDWFLSDLWFEASGDYSPSDYGFTMSDPVIAAVRADPVAALFDFLAFGDEAARREAVSRYSKRSANLIGRMEARRALVAVEPLAMRRRAYGANLLLEELDFLFATARQLGLAWITLGDIGSSLGRSLMVDIPILNVERELIVRLETQARVITENDLRDLAAFIVVLPLASIIVAEKAFVNLARQARLDECYGTRLLTSVSQLG